MILKYNLGNNILANEIFRNIVKLFPKHPTSGSARHELSLQTKAFGLIKDTTLSIKNLNTQNEFSLSEAHPNPFNLVTKISYTIPKASYVKLEIYNSLGEKVETLVNETKEAGSYTAHFNGANFASGVYIYRLQTNGKTISKKMILMK